MRAVDGQEVVGGTLRPPRPRRAGTGPADRRAKRALPGLDVGGLDKLRAGTDAAALSSTWNTREEPQPHRPTIWPGGRRRSGVSRRSPLSARGRPGDGPMLAV